MRIEFTATCLSAVPRPAPVVDLAPLVETVQGQLAGGVSPQRIREELRRLLEGEFAGARVTAYLPILLTRYTCESLRREQVSASRGQS